MSNYYQLLLDDYAAPSCTSFNKDYYGTLQELYGFFKAMKEDEKTAEQQEYILSVYDKYLAGNKTINHNVAYQEVPFLIPAKVLGTEKSVFTDYSWDHFNTWNCLYRMKCEKAESTHIWVSCNGKYARCIQTKFTNLLYESPTGRWVSHDGWMLGFPHQLEYDPPYTFSRLFVVEKVFKKEEEAMNDIKNFIHNPDPVFKKVLDDLFGNG